MHHAHDPSWGTRPSKQNIWFISSAAAMWCWQLCVLLVRHCGSWILVRENGREGIEKKYASSPFFEGWSRWFSQLKQIRKREMERGSTGACFLASIPLLLVQGKGDLFCSIWWRCSKRRISWFTRLLLEDKRRTPSSSSKQSATLILGSSYIMYSSGN